MLSKAVFFDRDGVLIQAVMRGGKAYGPNHLSEFVLNPQAPGVVAELIKRNYLIFVVTNQPDVARNLMTLELVEIMNQNLVAALGGTGVIRGVYVCPHDNHHQCACRKPKPGMILEAAKTWPVDFAQSFMIGDRSVDIQAGKSAGLKSILLRAPYNQGVTADYCAADLEDACRWIGTQSEAAPAR